jgi:hypothetical protein
VKLMQVRAGALGSGDSPYIVTQTLTSFPAFAAGKGVHPAAPRHHRLHAHGESVAGGRENCLAGESTFPIGNYVDTPPCNTHSVYVCRILPGGARVCDCWTRWRLGFSAGALYEVGARDGHRRVRQSTGDTGANHANVALSDTHCGISCISYIVLSHISYISGISPGSARGRSKSSVC